MQEGFIPARVLKTLRPQREVEEFFPYTLIILGDLFPPAGDSGDGMSRAQISPALDRYINPFPIPVTVIDTPLECRLQEGAIVEAVVTPEVCTQEKCPIEVDLFDEEFDPLITEVLSAGELPDLALVLYNRVDALLGSACRLCPGFIQEECDVYQAARDMKNGGSGLFI